MDGDKAIAIIAKALSEPDLTGMFTEALEHLSQFEQKMGANKVVVAITTDGKTELTKEWSCSKKSKMGDIDNGEILTYKCTLPVFAETLWRAFGDGASQKGEPK
jgi:hypothetical protein